MNVHDDDDDYEGEVDDGNYHDIVENTDKFYEV